MIIRRWLARGATVAVAFLVVGRALAGALTSPPPEPARVRLSVGEAVRRAQEAVPGRVLETDVEREDGRLVYEVAVAGAEGVTRVEVDAGDGAVVGRELDRDEEDDGDDDDEGDEEDDGEDDGDRDDGEDDGDRQPVGAVGPPPPLPLARAVDAATGAAPGQAVGVRLDRSAGSPVWRVRVVLDATGAEVEVGVDATTGAVEGRP